MANDFYPQAEHVDDRIRFTWHVKLMSPGPSGQYHGRIADHIIGLLQAKRRTSLSQSGRDLDQLAPRLQLQNVDQQTLNVAIEYAPEGVIGDCEMMCLWTPLLLIDSLWGIKELQGQPRENWRLLRQHFAQVTKNAPSK